MREGLPERGHFLVRGATVLSMDPAIGELARADIEVRDGTIAAIGSGLSAPGAEVTDATSMIALPGFVDTHWHLWGTLMRGVIGDGKEHGWFARKARLGPHFTPDDIYRGVRLAATEGLASGITTMHDWAHNIIRPEDVDANLQAHRELGTRVHFSYSAPSAAPTLSFEEMRRAMAEGGKPVDEPMDFTDVARAREEWIPDSEGLLSVGVALRGPARSEPHIYRREWEQARELGMKISMHCAGTRKEIERIRQVQALADAGLLGPDMLLAHCLYISAEERSLVAEHGIPISMSPMSELRLAMGFPPILDTIEAGVSVSLSLDTTAISANADVFQAMRVAVGLEAAGRGDPLALAPRRVLELTTIEAARALGLGDVVGSLAPGKRADFVLIRTDQPNLAPVVDPAVAVVHSAQPANVDTVMVDGRFLKRAGRLTAVDATTVVAEAEEALQALCARAGFELPRSMATEAG
jgi:5-methylthioadenosine/S-adenosylhomocysteine deaminase